MPMIDISATSPLMKESRVITYANNLVSPTALLMLHDGNGYPCIRLSWNDPAVMREIANAMLAEANNLEKEINA